ncbi:unnamed protein product [Chrysoparadoxa australica]
MRGFILLLTLSSTTSFTFPPPFHRRVSPLPAASYDVQIRSPGDEVQVIHVLAGSTILDAMEEAGMDAPHRSSLPSLSPCSFLQYSLPHSRYYHTMAPNKRLSLSLPSCRTGLCTECAALVEKGMESVSLDAAVLDPEVTAKGFILTCSARITGPSVELLSGQNEQMYDAQYGSFREDHDSMQGTKKPSLLDSIPFVQGEGA